MDYTENTIVPHTNNLSELYPKYVGNFYNHTTDKIYAQYVVYYPNYAWNHIYEINVSGFPFLDNKMTVREILEVCPNVEIWYLGYSSGQCPEL